MKQQRGAAFLSAKPGGLSTDSPNQTSAPRLPLFDPKVLNKIRKSGYSVEEMAEGMRKIWQSLPTVKQVMENIENSFKEK